MYCIKSSVFIILVCSLSQIECWLTAPSLRTKTHQYLAKIHSIISPQDLDNIGTKMGSILYYLNTFLLQDLVENPKEAYNNVTLDISPQLRSFSQNFKSRVYECETNIRHVVQQLQYLRTSDNNLAYFEHLGNTFIEKNVVVCNESIQVIPHLDSLSEILAAQKIFLNRNVIGEAQENVVVTSYYVAFTFIDQIDTVIWKLKDLVYNIKLLKESCTQSLSSQYSAMNLVTKLCPELPSTASRILLPQAMECALSGEYLQLNLVLHAATYGKLFTEEMSEIFLITFAGVTLSNLLILYVYICYNCKRKGDLHKEPHFSPSSHTESARFLPLQYDETQLDSLDG